MLFVLLHLMAGLLVATLAAVVVLFLLPRFYAGVASGNDDDVEEFGR